MPLNRVKYYGIYDLATSHCLIKADELVIKIDSILDSMDINDIIECQNILYYIDAGVNKWSDSTTEKLKNAIKAYILKAKKNSINMLYKQVDEILHEEFWELFSKYHLFESNSEEEFKSFLFEQKPYIRFILQNINLVKVYDESLKEYFISNVENTIMLFDYLEIDHITKKKKIYLPNSLTTLEKERLIIDYINSKDVNIAYLDIIQCFRNSDVLFISDKTKLLAKKRNEIERDKILESENTFESGVEIRYIYSQPTEVIIEQNGMNVKYTYSLDWIENNLDESTLWNNFIYLFEYVDFQMRIKLISKVSEIGIFEQLMGVKTKNQYSESFYFIHKQNLSNLQLLSYINVLRKNEVYVENLIEWYFPFYLLNEFNINNYIVKMPSRNTSYLEKCRMITPEIESILKQYSLYVHDGIIDTDLLCISSTPIAISECKSLVDIKNVYCKSDECDNIKYYLFSDQCMLAYDEKNNKSYHSFFNIMKSAKVYITTYPDYLQKDINWLKEHDIIKIMDDGQIKFNDPIIILIFQDLYLNDFINYYSNPSFIRNKIDLLIEKGILEFDNCLFSKFEQDYLNYHLNKQKFDNSLDLRNKYAHSSHSKEQDAEVHKNNYIILMKIMILIIIKINDDIEKREKLNSEI